MSIASQVCRPSDRTRRDALGLGLRVGYRRRSSSPETTAQRPRHGALDPGRHRDPGSSTATSSLGAANDAFCASTAALRTEVADLKSLASDDSATSETLTTQKQAAVAAADKAKAEAENLDRAVQVQVAVAVEAFGKALDAIPDDSDRPRGGRRVHRRHVRPEQGPRRDRQPGRLPLRQRGTVQPRRSHLWVAAGRQRVGRLAGRSARSGRRASEPRGSSGSGLLRRCHRCAGDPGLVLELGGDDLGADVQQGQELVRTSG